MYGCEPFGNKDHLKSFCMITICRKINEYYTASKKRYYSCNQFEDMVDKNLFDKNKGQYWAYIKKFTWQFCQIRDAWCPLDNNYI